jgi:hypothetical protein
LQIKASNVGKIDSPPIRALSAIWSGRVGHLIVEPPDMSPKSQSPTYSKEIKKKYSSSTIPKLRITETNKTLNTGAEFSIQ